MCYIKCSVTCGKGWRFRYIECRNSEGKPSNVCPNELKPDYYEQCEGVECYSWEVGSWSKCSSECGEGVKRRKVACHNKDDIVVDEKKCKLSEKPDDTSKCVEKSNCLKWITGNWSEVECKNNKNSLIYVLALTHMPFVLSVFQGHVP